ncbi:MAG: hypothetical protein ACOH1U_06945 [Rhodoglobus sp.]
MRLIITVEDDKPSPAASLTPVADAVAENAGMSGQQAVVGGSNQQDGSISFESELTDEATSAGAAPDAPATSEPTFSGQTADDFDVSTATSAGAAPDAPAEPEASSPDESELIHESTDDNSDISAGAGSGVG